MADIDTSWTWNFSGPTTMSKAHSRPSLPKDVAWDLIGFDGNETGCLRTHPGFVALTSFTPTDAFLEFKPVNVLTSSTTYLFGFVWFEYSAASTSVKVYGKFNNGSSWLNPNGTNNPGGLIATFTGIASGADHEFDVQVMGRYLLIFMRGQKPKLAFVTVSTTWSAIASDAGPGEAPKISITASTATLPTGSRINPANSDICVSVHSSGSGAHVPSGNYSIAVQYMSTATGRKSALSNTVTIAAGAANNHISYQVFRLTTDYNRLLIYRSVNQGGNSGASVYGAGALHLDQVVDISTLTGSASAPSTLQVWNASTDEQLVYQDVYVDKGKCDTYMPKGGIAGFMGNTLFVSRISDSSSALPSGISGVTPESPPRGLGDMRWSNTGEMQPENFNPSNRWVPKTPANEVINMRQVGLYLMAFSGDRIYRVGRSGQFIRVEEGHIGYGLQARNGIETIGSMVYFVSGGGLKAISSEGQIEDVTALDNLLNIRWLTARSSTQLAFDAQGQCLTVLNPTPTEEAAAGEAALLWFGTNRVTQLIDLPFFKCTTGYFKASVDTSVQRRALFLKYDSAETIGVYMVDHARQYNVETNLCGGDRDLNDPCQIWNCNLAPPASIPTSAYGCMAYNVDTCESIPVNELYNEWVTSPQSFLNQVYSIAPIVQQWVGGNIGVQIQPGEPEFKDFFRQKQVSSCAAYYETLAAPPVDPLVSIGDHDTAYPPTASWQALLYRGLETLPLATAKPLERGGAVMASFDANDPSLAARIANAPFGKHGVVWPTLSPSWRCVLSGVEVRLLAFSAVGRILDSDRRYV